jgi:hypothetical protein
MNYKVITNTNKKSIVTLSKKLIPFLLCLMVLACQQPSQPSSNIPAEGANVPIEGTWRLYSATSITNGVSASTVDTAKTRMIKIINGSHFAFLKHDIHLPKDSANHFDAGGGSYTIRGDQYTEHLDYYVDRHWEGQTFHFTVSLHGDTLVQRGQEKVPETGVDREIIERYVRATAD